MILCSTTAVLITPPDSPDRNHIQCITAMLLALCTFTVIEISRGELISQRKVAAEEQS